MAEPSEIAERRRKRVAMAMCECDCRRMREGQENVSCGKPCGVDAPCDGWRHWLPYADAAIEVTG